MGWEIAEGIHTQRLTPDLKNADVTPPVLKPALDNHFFTGSPSRVFPHFSLSLAAHAGAWASPPDQERRSGQGARLQARAGAEVKESWRGAMRITPG